MTSKRVATSEGGHVDVVSPDIDKHKPKRGQVPLHLVDLFEAVPQGLGIKMWEAKDDPENGGKPIVVFIVTYINPTVGWDDNKGGYMVNLDKAEMVCWERAPDVDAA
jgi:hypothetical protein